VDVDDDAKVADSPDVVRSEPEDSAKVEASARLVIGEEGVAANS